MKDLREMTSKELKEMAKGMKISNWWNLKKEILIKKIEEAQNMSEEEKQKIADQKTKEDELFEHYQHNWRKYGPTNNWTDFLKKYKSGKITLIEDKLSDINDEEKEHQSEETIIEESQVESEEVSEESKQKPKTKNKKPNLKLTELTYNGETKSIREWAKELEMPWPTLYDRVNRNGWTTEEAIEIPLGGRRKK